MQASRALIASALAGLVARLAGRRPVAMAADKEKCFRHRHRRQKRLRQRPGHSQLRAGQATKDKDPGDWKFVAKGSCEKSWVAR